MKIYKSKPNKYGWYYVIHQNKNKDLKIFKKCLNKKRLVNEKELRIHGEGIKLLEEVIGKQKTGDLK